MNSDTGELRRYRESEEAKAIKDGFDTKLTEEEFKALQEQLPKDRKEILDNMRKSPFGKNYFAKKKEEPVEDKTGNRPGMQIMYIDNK